MTYDSPLWAFEEEVITDVSNFKEDGLVTPEGKKVYFENWFVHLGNWTLVAFVKARVLITTATCH